MQIMTNRFNSYKTIDVILGFLNCTFVSSVSSTWRALVSYSDTKYVDQQVFFLSSALGEGHLTLLDRRRNSCFREIRWKPKTNNLFKSIENNKNSPNIRLDCM